MNRTLLLGAAWTASAGAAVGLGFLAVSLVDASASPVVQPVSSRAPESADATSSRPPAVSPAPSGEQATPGGTVFATCAGGTAVPVLAGAPAAGWWPDDSQDPGKFEFKSATRSIEVRASCVGGTPRFVVEGPRSDDRARGTDVANPAASRSDAPDDSAGRVGGGHGADDGPGDDRGVHSGPGGGSDDSSGREGGGHGSDD
jgi:hypothetical protein